VRRSPQRAGRARVGSPPGVGAAQALTPPGPRACKTGTYAAMHNRGAGALVRPPFTPRADQPWHDPCWANGAEEQTSA
jgi:hypothetical protein